MKGQRRGRSGGDSGLLGQPQLLDQDLQNGVAAEKAGEANLGHNKYEGGRDLREEECGVQRRKQSAGVYPSASATVAQ